MPFVFSSKQEREEVCNLETNPFFWKKYYIYRHIRLDTNTPFYIGVGSHGARAPYARAFAFTLAARRSLKWYQIYNKAPIDVDIIFESDDREEIFTKEIEFISIYKRELDGGVLVNNSTGGKSILGAQLNLTYEARRRLAARCYAQRGENHPSAKLKESDVLLIIKLMNKGHNWKTISKEVPGLSKANLVRIRKGRTWAHLHHLVEKTTPPSRADNIIHGADVVPLQLILDLYASGLSKAKMTKQVGVNREIIDEVLRRSGVRTWTKRERIDILGERIINQYTK